MNARWHDRHRLPRNATLEQRMAWHQAHQKQCACRPIPAKLAAQMRTAPERRKETAKRAGTPAGGVEVDPAFAAVIATFANDRHVTCGKMMASVGLKFDGRIFAMVVRGRLVVKLPTERVAELVQSGTAAPFDPRRDGRLMKEWVELAEAKESWTALAREAHDFAKTGKPPSRARNARRHPS